MYSGFWDSVKDVIGGIGVNADTAAAVAKAFASPTNENILNVERAFAMAGTSAPPELMNALYQRYYQAVRDNPYYGSGQFTLGLTNLLPWIIGGGLLFLAFGRKRGK